MNRDERCKAVERILLRNGAPRRKVRMLAFEIVGTLPSEGYELVACAEWSRERDRVTYSENGIPDDPDVPIVPLLEGQSCLPDGTVVGKVHRY